MDPLDAFNTLYSLGILWLGVCLYLGVWIDERRQRKRWFMHCSRHYSYGSRSRRLASRETSERLTR
jgi:hypothetical protein